MLTTDKTKAGEPLYQGLQLISKDVTACSFQVHGKKCNASHAVLDLLYMQHRFSLTFSCTEDVSLEFAGVQWSSESCPTPRAVVGYWQEQ